MKVIKSDRTVYDYTGSQPEVTLFKYNSFLNLLVNQLGFYSSVCERPSPTCGIDPERLCHVMWCKVYLLHFLLRDTAPAHHCMVGMENVFVFSHSLR